MVACTSPAPIHRLGGVKVHLIRERLSRAYESRDLSPEIRWPEASSGHTNYSSTVDTKKIQISGDESTVGSATSLALLKPTSMLSLVSSGHLSKIPRAIRCLYNIGYRNVVL